MTYIEDRGQTEECYFPCKMTAIHLLAVYGMLMIIILLLSCSCLGVQTLIDLCVCYAYDDTIRYAVAYRIVYRIVISALRVTVSSSCFYAVDYLEIFSPE